MHAHLSKLAISVLFFAAGKAEAQVENGMVCPPQIKGFEAPSEPDTWDKLPDQRVLSNVIGVSECWSADVSNGSQQYMNDLYTSLVVDRVLNEDETRQDSQERTSFARDYRSERRSPFARIFVGRTSSLLVSIKVHIKDPDVDFTVPLVSIDYNGKSGQGESFVTNLTRSEMGQPYFRLTPTTSMSVTVDARSSSGHDFNVGGAVVSTLKEALALAAPGSSLVTSVNSAQFSKIANTFDSGLSRIWSNSISESTASSRMISEWYPASAIYVSVDVPNSVRTYDDRKLKNDPSSASNRRTLWFRIKLACPRISIFDTTNVCEFEKTSSGPKPVTRRSFTDSPYTYKRGTPGPINPNYGPFLNDIRYRVDPHQVLNYNLSAGKTIRQFVTEQPWFASMTKNISPPVVTQESTKSEPSPALMKTAEFCETVAEQLYNSGLSNLDSKIALWSLIEGLPDFVAVQSKFENDKTCDKHVPSGWIGLSETEKTGTLASDGLASAGTE